MDNIIICNNFATELDYLINANYKNRKILIITDNVSLIKHKNGIDYLSKIHKIDVVILSENCSNNYMFNSYVSAKITDDVGLIVAFGDKELIGVVRLQSTKKKVNHVVIPVVINDGDYEGNYVIYRDDLPIKKTVEKPIFCILDTCILSEYKLKKSASCYGKLMSNYVAILDIIFNSKVYNKKFLASDVFEIENILNEILLIPSTTLKSGLGMMKVFFALLKTQAVLAKENQNLPIDSFAILILHFNNYKISIGEALMLSSIILTKMYSAFFKDIQPNIYYTPNYLLRSKKLKNILNIDYNVDIHYFESKINKENIALKAKSNQILFEKICKKYVRILDKSFIVFKNFYNDKGFFMGSFLSKNIVYNALSMSPDAYNSLGVTTFLRDFGLLEINSFIEK